MQVEVPFEEIALSIRQIIDDDNSKEAADILKRWLDNQVDAAVSEANHLSN